MEDQTIEKIGNFNLLAFGGDPPIQLPQQRGPKLRRGWIPSPEHLKLN
jgi:hypothetical protein